MRGGLPPRPPSSRNCWHGGGGGGENFQQPRFHRSAHWFFTRKNQRGQPTKTKTNELHWLLHTLSPRPKSLAVSKLSWGKNVDIFVRKWAIWGLLSRNSYALVFLDLGMYWHSNQRVPAARASARAAARARAGVTRQRKRR